MELLKRLTETPGVPGREERVKQVIRDEAGSLFDEERTDSMGNLIFLTRAGRKPASGRPLRVLLACHVDEIGFYVRAIDKEGRLRVQPVGGFDPRNLFARRVLVQGRRDLLGVMNPATKPIHIASDEEKKKIPQVNEFYVDLFLPKEQVDQAVRVGDPITLVQNLEKVGDVYTGKALDNRVGSWVAIRAIQKIAAGSLYDIYYVATVQEEVGLRGAGPGAFGIDPDIAISVDTTLAIDTPGVADEDTVTKLGQGVAIKVMDRGTISDPQLFDEFVTLAQNNRIPHQIEVAPGGRTDAAAMQLTGRGYPALPLSIPTRYIHTVCEAVHQRDLQAAVDLLAAWLTTESKRKVE